MKILAKDQSEFEDIIRTSKYLHDFVVETNKRLNLKFWRWWYINDDGEIHFDPYTSDFICLDLWEYPILNTIAHLYRIEHADSEGCFEEQEYLDKTFYIPDHPK